LKDQARPSAGVTQPPARVRRLFEHAEDLDAVVTVNGPPDATFFWATGLHDGGTFEGSAAILRPDEAVTVVTSPLEETTARRSDNRVVIYDDREDFWDELADRFTDGERVGFDATQVSVDRHRKLDDELPVDLEPADEAIQRARLVKDPAEVDRIEEAARITDRIAEEMQTYVDRADEEAELAAGIVHEILTEGAKLSFDPIVANGAGSAEPHYAPGRVELTDGPLLIDMGAQLAGYCSDITRTYAIGEPSKQLRRMHEVVLEAQQAALDAIQPGMEAADVHEIAREVIDDTRFEGRFIHSLGHALGVEVHDGPGLSPSSEVTIEEGMVFTVEPGVYVPGDAGVRIEEDVVVTSDGCRRLTHADRGLRTLSL
jgi:Xaa-Pro dipeptidase